MKCQFCSLQTMVKRAMVFWAHVDFPSGILDNNIPLLRNNILPCMWHLHNLQILPTVSWFNFVPSSWGCHRNEATQTWTENIMYKQVFSGLQNRFRTQVVQFHRRRGDLENVHILRLWPLAADFSSNCLCTVREQSSSS